MNARCFTVAAVLLASGCAPKWVSPTREDSAKLTWVPDASGYVHAYVFPDGKECKKKHAISGFGGLKGRTEIRVPSGADFTALANIADGQWSCKVAMTFTPQAKGAYAVVVSGSGRSCKMGIGRYEGGKVVPEPSSRPRPGKECE